MTSASELFYNRRTRLGRNATDLGLFDSSPNINSHHHANRRHQSNHSQNHHRRHGLDGCDPLRRSPFVRHLPPRLPYSERETVLPDQSSSQYPSGDTISAEASIHMTNRSSFARNERLPGSVLLARERLLERLQGVSLSGNRQSGRDILGELRLDDETVWLTRGYSSTESTQIESNKTKPPGLTQEALNSLPSEIFSNMEKCVEGTDCSICLESFMEGEELIRLPCEHRFHYFCLDPWIRICGDCPYCRRSIRSTH